MNRALLPILTSLIFGCPGSCLCLGGGLVLFFALLADTAQLKLDTNLDRADLITGGLLALAASLLLLAIPLIAWVRSARKLS
jgi:hypothetical protein